MIKICPQINIRLINNDNFNDVVNKSHYISFICGKNETSISPAGHSGHLLKLWHCTSHVMTRYNTANCI